MRVQVIQIPSQTTEDVLARFQQDINFTSAFLANPINISLHVPLRVSRAYYRDLCLQQLRESLLPFERAGRVTQTGVEEDYKVQVRVEWLEVIRFVHCMEVVNVGGDLHLSTQSVFHNAAEGVLRRPLREREFFVPVGHAFRSNEDQVEQGTGKDVTELKPDIAGQRRFGTSSEDEDSDWGRFDTQSLDIGSLSGLRGMQSVSQSLIGRY